MALISVYPSSDAYSANDAYPSRTVTGGAVWRFGCQLVSPTTRQVLSQTVDVELMGVGWAYRAVDPTHSVEVADSTPRRTGQLRIRHVPGFNPLAVWYRPWIEQLQPDGSWLRSVLGTFTCARMPGVSRDATATTRIIPLAEVSVRWSERRLAAPLNLEPGTNVVGWIVDDLQLRFAEIDTAGIQPSPKTVAANTTWDHDWLVFDAGTLLIDVYDRLLAYAGYEPLRVDRYGKPVAHPARDFAAESVSLSFGGDGVGISPEVDISPVTPEIPNVVTFAARNAPSLAEEGNGWRTVRNEDTGPGSIQQRGSIVESPTVTVDADSQAELDQIARYRAPLIFAGGGWTLDATARAIPDLDDCDVVDVTHSVGTTGRWLVTAYGFSAIAGQESAIVDMDLQAELLAGAAFAVDALAKPPAVATTGVAYRGVAL